MRLEITCIYRYLRRHLLSGRFLRKDPEEREEIGEDLDGPHRTGVIVAGVANVAAVSVVVITSFVAGSLWLVAIKVSGVTISMMLMVTSLVVSEDVGAEDRALVELKTNAQVDGRLIAATGVPPGAGRTFVPSVVAMNEAVVGAIDVGRCG